MEVLYEVMIRVDAPAPGQPSAIRELVRRYGGDFGSVWGVARDLGAAIRRARDRWRVKFGHEPHGAAQWRVSRLVPGSEGDSEARSAGGQYERIVCWEGVIDPLRAEDAPWVEQHLLDRSRGQPSP